MRQSAETRVRTTPRRTDRGGAKQVVIAAMVALGIGLSAAYRLYQGGNTNWSYLIAMSVTVVVALALVAPERFSGEHREPGDWSNQVRALQQRREARARELENTASVNSAESSNDEASSTKL